MPLPRLAQIAIGGALGASLRWALLEAVDAGVGADMVLLAINVFGSFVLGVVWARTSVARTDTPDWVRPVLAVGWCGGFTSFSSFTVRIAQQFDAGEVAAGGWWMAATVVAAIGAVALGHNLGRRMGSHLGGAADTGMAPR